MEAYDELYNLVKKIENAKVVIKNKDGPYSNLSIKSNNHAINITDSNLESDRMSLEEFHKIIKTGKTISLNGFKFFGSYFDTDGYLVLYNY